MPGRYALYLSTADGLYRSTDAAESWERWPSPLHRITHITANSVGDVFAVADVETEEFVGLLRRHKRSVTARGVFMLRSGEDEWRPTHLIAFHRGDAQAEGITGIGSVMAFNADSVDLVLADTNRGMWASEDRGQSWLQIGPWKDGVEPRTRSFLACRSRLASANPNKHPLILVADHEWVIHWAWWGDLRHDPTWHSYDAPGPSIFDLFELPLGDEVYAYTINYGLYFNRDVRSSAWQPLHPWQQMLAKNVPRIPDWCVAPVAPGGRVLSMNRPMRTAAPSARKYRLQDCELEHDGLRSLASPPMDATVSQFDTGGVILAVNSHQIVATHASQSLGRGFSFPYTQENWGWWCLVWDDRLADPFNHGAGRSGISRPVYSPFFEEDGTVFAVSGRSGVLRSTDAGLSWRQANHGLESSVGDEHLLAYYQREFLVCLSLSGRES